MSIKSAFELLTDHESTRVMGRAGVNKKHKRKRMGVLPALPEESTSD